MPSSEKLSFADVLGEYKNEKKEAEYVPMPSFSEHMARLKETDDSAKKAENLSETEKEYRQFLRKTYEPIANLIERTESQPEKNLVTAILGDLYSDEEKNDFEYFSKNVYDDEDGETKFNISDDAESLAYVVGSVPISDLRKELKDWSSRQMEYHHGYLYQNNLARSVAEVLVVGYDIEREKNSGTNYDDERMYDFRDEVSGQEMPELKKHIIRLEAKKILEKKSDDEYDDDDNYIIETITPFQSLINEGGSREDDSEQSKSTRLGFLKELFSGKSPEEALETSIKPLAEKLTDMLLSDNKPGIDGISHVVEQCKVLGKHIELEQKSYEHYKQLINRGNEILLSTAE